ncbi:esterase/lipase superfamily enzyme [Phyllobacterium sp. 1468]|uniref:alpha/beta hydrolase n=1 Tax=Phyllobacterium sp. 1468 TaxID=2817759 RepID=UPI001B5F6EFC|nr:alpha/beta hydrolase [Phyllobacterium sp. 1468]MDR6634845.1 esterase/lipase superfamily enzyme [Phyllobacterium sp. 1468]
MVSRKMVKHYHHSPAAISSSESIDMNYISGATEFPQAPRRRVAALPVLGFILTLALAGCAGHARGVMTPVAITGATGGSTVDMLVVTSRVPSHDPATLFTGERSPTPYLTDITVSIPSDARRKPGTVQWPKKVPPNPETDFAVTKVRQLHSTDEGRAWFRQHVVNGHAMVFVHGFNNRYEDSVFRFAQIIHDSKAQVTPILFTWPSRARVFDYNYDKESTNFSRTALEQGLQTLAKDKDVKEITVMAHSMGTWLAMESLRQMAIRDGRVQPKIKNVILASPDIDVDVFARQWNELGKDKPKITIFVSQDDRALKVSRLISGDVDRLGAINPAAEPYKTKLEAAGITVVDLTQIKTGDGLRHGKFAESPDIVQLIGQRLVTGQTLTDSDVSFADGVTAVVAGGVGTVGKVAATTVSAPLTVLEGNKIEYRRPKSDRVNETLNSKPPTPELSY